MGKTQPCTGKLAKKVGARKKKVKYNFAHNTNVQKDQYMIEQAIRSAKM